MIPHYAKLQCVSLPLTTGVKGRERVPAVSGLNWGQRPGREPNQAYIAVPSALQRLDFLPSEGIEFLVHTADGEHWRCARRQANGKAIHTIESNSIIGRYFRRKLNVEDGGLVTLSHLVNYGRTSIELYKVSSVEFLLDFETNF